ncbi:MAG: hypothetical protein ACPG49_06645 [Chitinophagales bacterium]
MMKRRTFVQAASVLGASFCSGLSASAQILQPTLPSFVSLHIKDLKKQVLQNTNELNISNRYAFTDALFSVKTVVNESYKGDDYVFTFKNYSGNLIQLSKKKGVFQAKMS